LSWPILYNPRTHFGLDLAVCCQTPPEVHERVFSLVEIRYTNGWDAIVSVEGKETRIGDIEIEDLLAALDATEGPISEG